MPLSESKLSQLVQDQLKKTGDFYDSAQPLSKTAQAYRRTLAHYYNLLIPEAASVLEVGCGSGDLLALLTTKNVTGVDISANQLKLAQAKVPYGTFFQQAGEVLEMEGRKFDFIILSDTLNHVADVQALLGRLRHVCHKDTRLLVNCYNTLWRPACKLARLLGMQRKEPDSSWLSTADLESLVEIAGWDVIKTQARILLPLPLGPISSLFNRWLAPVLPFACLGIFIVARPRADVSRLVPASVSVVVPARNEAGNIEAAITRTPQMGSWTELIFVEGNSTDNTWAEIQRVYEKYKHSHRIKILQQPGKGKGDAVRAGYAVAEGDILMILDADLTMPPEELPKYYEAVASGTCDFANGSRLVYPMDDKAMQFLNLIANKTFGILFSWMLDQRVKDTLCGTKVLTRANYLKLAANRSYFGDFDPFGDFDLLFGADKLNLKIRDIPIRYRERTYGNTNIHRWRHGWLLLRMVLFAARKIKFV